MSDPGFTLVQLRYFVTAARLGSMTAASRHLMVSQSAVSTAVAQLEKELGVQLLLRHHAKGLTLTAAGHGVLAEATRLLEQSADLAKKADESAHQLAGTLSVGCFSTLAPFELPLLLDRYHRKHPGVVLDVLEGEHAGLKSRLRSAECEVALMYDYDLDDDIDSVTIGLVTPYVIVARGHRHAKRESIRLAELADEPMVLLDLPHSGSYLRSVVESVGIAPQVRYRTSGFETVRSMVAHGHGYAILNQHPAHNLTYDGAEVVPLRIDDDVEPLRVVVASMRGVRLTRRARAFVALATSPRALAITSTDD